MERLSKEKTPWAWWLLPIIFTWLGGIVAWSVVKNSDKSKARGLMILGFVMVAIWVVIYVVIAIVAV